MKKTRIGDYIMTTVNVKKVLGSVIGIVMGIIIIIIGIAVMNPDTYTIGEPTMAFGADFYTEIYDVTRDVGAAVQRSYSNVCNAIGWLIIAIGITNISFFVFKILNCSENFEFINEFKNNVNQPIEEEQSKTNQFATYKKDNSTVIEKFLNQDKSKQSNTNQFTTYKKTAIVGECENCEKKNCDVVFTEFEDGIGVRNAFLCSDCYSKYKISEETNDNTEKSTASYCCGKCGHEGPFEGNCPKCNSSLKKYNI